MPGLFTLGSETLGIIGTNALGGPGTGFVDGTASTTGSVAGAQGFAGSAAGSTTSTGSVAGTFGASGQVTGTTTSSGSVTGTEGNTGTITGSSTTSGAAAGSKAAQGTVTGSVSALGAVTGTPDLTGTVAGSVASTGSVTGSGSQPQPPTPPEPEPTAGVGGGGYIPQIRPARIRPRPTAHSGRVRSHATTTGTIAGRCGYVGGTQGTTTTHGHISGDRWPTDDLLRMWHRQAMEAELLSLDLL